MKTDRSKWDVLVERREAAYKAFKELQDQMWSYERQNCDLTCSGCGAVLETEADFAKHFLIPDERYLNLGYCPVKDKGSRTRTS
jgi:hypothetical protein